MNCDFYIALISGHIDAVNTEKEEERLQMHLDQCEHCRALLETMQENDAILKSAKVEAPADLTASIMSEVRKTPIKRKKKPFYISVAASGLAVAAMLTIIFAGKLMLPEKSADSANKETAAKRSYYGRIADESEQEAVSEVLILEAPPLNTGAAYAYAETTDEAFDKVYVSDQTPVLVVYAAKDAFSFAGEKIEINELRDKLKSTTYSISGKETAMYAVTWEELLRIAAEYDDVFEMEKYYSDDEAYLNAIIVFAE